MEGQQRNGTDDISCKETVIQHKTKIKKQQSIKERLDMTRTKVLARDFSCHVMPYSTKMSSPK